MSPSCEVPFLSDNNIYPRFFRTVQAFVLTNIAILELLNYYGWNRAAVVQSGFHGVSATVGLFFSMCII